ncbi:MAG: hypothetical protein JO332_11455 [Planctomycetaceae bacterium]|nr:hypothetical protein [Planctomycetaceae bacterium]
MRVWRTAGGFFVESGPSREAVVSTLATEIADPPWSDRSEFAVLDPQRKLLRRHRLMVWSVEEELGISAWAVVGGTLKNRIVSQFHSAGFRVVRREEDVEQGLSVVPESDGDVWAAARRILEEIERADRR